MTEPSPTPVEAARQGLGRKTAVLLWLLCGAGLVLLYVPGPDYYSPRVIRAGWTLGHVGLFCLLAMAIAHALVPFWQRSGARLFVLLGLALVLMGAVTELLQGLTSYRDPTLEDLWLDTCGALLGLALTRPLRQTLPRLWRKSVVLLALPGVVLSFLPLTLAAVDDYLEWRQFPVLSGLENPLEMLRWHASSSAYRTHSMAWQGCCSLAVQLQPGGFSGVSARHFRGDWRGFRTFHVDIHADHHLRLTLRINDFEHEHSPQHYADRFNRQINLKPGWNSVNIPLSAILNGPAHRHMDLARMRDIGLYVYDLKRSETIYIDNMRLLP